MALTAAGRRMLRHGATTDMFKELIRRDPTAEQGIVPWDGQSPRDLTESSESVSLGLEGASLNEEDARIDEQSRRHLLGY